MGIIFERVSACLNDRVSVLGSIESGKPDSEITERLLQTHD